MSKKLYCYVDESGQDTEGRFFVVVAVVTGGEINELEDAAAQLEQGSGRQSTKWHNSRYRTRRAYTAALAKTDALQGHVYARIYGAGKNYLDRTAYVVADALSFYATTNKLGDTASIVTIDGLKPSEERMVGKVIRQRGIHVSKLRGARDESAVLIRLADSVAGILRDAYQDQNEDFQKNVDRLKRNGILTDI